jgi:hypothetical protein
MILIRLLVITFNVAVVGYLVYRMIEIARIMMPAWKKTFVIVGGAILLLVPVGMFFTVFRPSMSYFLIYPVAIAIYIYMIREL